MTLLDRVAELRSQGRDVLSLCAGEPGSGAPSAVRRRAAEIMADGTPLGYSPACGLWTLRTAIAGHYARWYDLDLDPRQIAVSTGSSGGFLGAFLAAFDHGGRVALARPGYPAYRNILRMLGCEVVDLDCGPAQRFQPTVSLLEAAHRQAPLAGLIVASPANPTGTTVPDDDLSELTLWCRDNGVRLVSDEIYHGVTYTGSPGTCVWSYDRAPIVVSSFSKYWGMTGWRLGWTVVPADLVDAIDALAGNFALCPPVPAQHAALAAFDDESYREADAAVADFAAARTIVLDALDRLGWVDVAPADGAFYVYAGIAPVLGRFPDSRSWCSALLDTTGVAITPGVDFDSVHGQRTIRLSLAAGPQTVAEAVRRILAFQAAAG